MVYRLVVLLFASLLSLTSIPANAVWKGTPNLENKRVVSVHFGQYTLFCSSGFLYSPRIVFTAAHVLHPADDRIAEHLRPAPTNWIWVGDPGKTVKTGTKRVQAQKLFIAPGYKSRDFWLGGNTITRENDFAVVVLDSPLPVDDKKVELLTPELHQQYIDSGEQIEMSGYGRQTPEDMKKNSPCKDYSSFQSKVVGKDFSTGGPRWTATLNTRVGVGMPNLCDSDSGAGYTKILPDKYIYLGAVGGGSWNQHNCGSFEPNLNLETTNGGDPVYLYKDLIAEAEKYVADNPYVEPKTNNAGFNNKTTIACVKGKTTKKVIGLTPKCPKGFKKK
jgi:hypothetical protein